MRTPPPKDCISPRTPARARGRNRSGLLCAILNAERIGHGLHAIEDPALVEHLAETQTPVEICVTSNVRTGCCLALREHPVRKFFDAGVHITLATDDPEMFHTTLCGEYQLLQNVFGFSEEELRKVAANSFRASFLSMEERRSYVE